MGHGPAVKSRTLDGLVVELEVSFQYQLNSMHLNDMYQTLGENYEAIFLRMAVEQLTTAATYHDAHFFFTNRTAISKEMHEALQKDFDVAGFAEIPFFRLENMHLPKEFDDAIKETTNAQQEIAYVSNEQKTKTVKFNTTVLQ